eukprot:596505-Rhodomonas_salina.3
MKTTRRSLSLPVLTTSTRSPPCSSTHLAATRALTTALATGVQEGGQAVPHGPQEAARGRHEGAPRHTRACEMRRLRCDTPLAAISSLDASLRASDLMLR